MQCGISCILGLSTLSAIVAGCKFAYSRMLENKLNERMQKVLANKPF